MRFLSIILILLSIAATAQYDPAGGEDGSISIHRDDASISGWASDVIINRGWLDLADTSLGKVSAGDPSNALEKADGLIVSLGDGGSATFYFENGIVNRNGYDLAVFENGFFAGGGYFLELAFVEVSVYGQSFIRFPAKSAADTSIQLTNADRLDPTVYHNLAGKHQAPYGSLFDLDELDLDTVYYVRIVDVIGSIDSSFGSRDDNNHIINDPYPSAFESGGFDLDAVGVVNGDMLSINNEKLNSTMVYPSLAAKGQTMTAVQSIAIFQADGRLLNTFEQGNFTIDVPGTYYIKSTKNKLRTIQKICVY